MTYEELKKIAQPHIRENDNLPSNSLLLLTQLHIPYKTEKQCREDFNGKYNPLDNCPAFLYIDEQKNKTMYFNTNTRYYNFYIFHEIAHYILGHEDNSPQNEMDANLLACILAAPIENFPTYIKTAEDLSSLCQIPIDRAEEYWAEIKNLILKPKSSIVHKILISAIIIVITTCLIITGFSFTETSFKTQHINNAIEVQKPDISTPEVQQVIVTSSGTRYHLPNCRYVKYKTNIIEKDINTAINAGYTPCKVCIK